MAINQKLYATFKPNSSLYNNVMVFTNLPKQAVWDIMVARYHRALDKILTEQELAYLMASGITKAIVPMNTVCNYQDPISKQYYVYPIDLGCGVSPVEPPKESIIDSDCDKCKPYCEPKEEKKECTD